MKLKLLDLFSGIGGFSLGLEQTKRIKTIAFVEKDKFCQKVLKKNFKNIPIEEDIRNVKGSNYAVDIVSGGFPCQPFSVAGKRKGTDDDRYLWDETIRVVRESKPRWFIGENVEGIININNGLVLRQVQTDLEKEGFEVQCLIIPASGIGAWHQRKRVWIIGCNVSNSNGILRKGGRTIEQSGTNKVWEFYPTQEEQTGQHIRSKTIGCDAVSGKTENVWNTKSTRLKSSINRQGKIQSRGTSSPRTQCKKTWWQTQSELCGIPNGVSYELDKDRTNRIKSLGNSIVPQIAYEIGKAIVESEENV